MESVPGMLLISPQAVMFEPTDSQPTPPAADDDSCTTVGDEAARRDCIIVPMDSISSIMISHHCDPMSTRYIHSHALTFLIFVYVAAQCDGKMFFFGGGGEYRQF